MGWLYIFHWIENWRRPSWELFIPILDHFFNFNFIIKDIIKRPFITFGFISFIFLIPMALTSTNNMIKKLGYKVWKKIHYLIYIIAILASLHFFMLVRANKTEWSPARLPWPLSSKLSLMMMMVAGRHNLRSFLAAYSTQNYFLSISSQPGCKAATIRAALVPISFEKLLSPRCIPLWFIRKVKSARKFMIKRAQAAALFFLISLSWYLPR